MARMLRCVAVPDPWIGKGMLFLRAAEALNDVASISVGVLDGHQDRRLREVSGVFRAAVAWVRFCNQELTGSEVPAGAQEAYQLLFDVTNSWDVFGPPSEYWQRVADASNAINAVLVGQHPGAQALADASGLCEQVGNLIGLRHRSSCGDV